MSSYPIIFQISLPRSGSTAALRCFEAQGIFQIFHEPSIKLYELKQRWGLTQFLFRPDHNINTFEQLEATLLKASIQSPVYVKDIAYSSYEWLSQSGLLKNPQVHFIFLIRSPYDQLVSISKQFEMMSIPLKMVTGVYDYEILERLIQVCRKAAPDRTLVIEADGLYQYPEIVIRTIAEQAKLEITQVNLEWPQKCSHFTGEEWHESKKPDYFRKWHHDAITSTSFQALPRYPQNWSQFSDPRWAQHIVKKNSAAYQRIFTCSCSCSEH